MPISNTKKSSFIQDNYGTLVPLHWLLGFIGLECNLTFAQKPRPYWALAKNFLRTSTLAIIDGFTLQYKLKYLYDRISPSIKYTDIVQMIFDFVQYIVDLYFVQKFGTTTSMEYFRQYETIDKLVGVINYSAIRLKLIRLIGMFTFFWISSTMCDYSAWTLSYGWLESSVYSIAYLFLFIKILTTLDLTSQVIHIESRLRAVADLMEYHCSATPYSSPLFEKNYSRRERLPYTVRVVEPERRSSTPRASFCGDHNEVKWLSTCYLLLTEQAAFINKMYGIRILLNSLSLLIDMIRFTNIAARILIGTHQTPYSSGYLPAVSSIMRMLTCASVLVSLVCHCEQVYRQRDRILNVIDHLLVYKNPNEKLKTAVTDFRSLVQGRPIDLNMAKFFRLDYSLLVSIASVVATYTIILLQNIN